MTLTRKTEIYAPEPVPFCPSQIPRGLTWNWIGIFAVRCRWLTDWTILRPILGHVMLAQWMSYLIKQVILPYRRKTTLQLSVTHRCYVCRNYSTFAVSSRNMCESTGYILYLRVHYRESTPWGVFGAGCWGECLDWRVGE